MYMSSYKYAFSSARTGQTSIHTVAKTSFFFLFYFILFFKDSNRENIQTQSEKGKSPSNVFLSLEQKLDKLLSPFPTNCRNLYATEYGRAEHVHYL